jgi:hypothetical protein
MTTRMLKIEKDVVNLNELGNVKNGVTRQEVKTALGNYNTAMFSQKERIDDLEKTLKDLNGRLDNNENASEKLFGEVTTATRELKVIKDKNEESMKEHIRVTKEIISDIGRLREEANASVGSLTNKINELKASVKKNNDVMAEREKKAKEGAIDKKEQPKQEEEDFLDVSMRLVEAMKRKKENENKPTVKAQVKKKLIFEEKKESKKKEYLSEIEDDTIDLYDQELLGDLYGFKIGDLTLKLKICKSRNTNKDLEKYGMLFSKIEESGSEMVLQRVEPSSYNQTLTVVGMFKNVMEEFRETFKPSNAVNPYKCKELCVVTYKGDEVVMSSFQPRKDRIIELDEFFCKVEDEWVYFNQNMAARYWANKKRRQARNGITYRGNIRNNNYRGNNNYSGNNNYRGSNNYRGYNNYRGNNNNKFNNYNEYKGGRDMNFEKGAKFAKDMYNAGIKVGSGKKQNF